MTPQVKSVKKQSSLPWHDSSIDRDKERNICIRPAGPRRRRSEGESEDESKTGKCEQREERVSERFKEEERRGKRREKRKK